MIVYSADKTRFRRDVLDNQIDNLVANAVLKRIGRHTAESERLSWRNSLQYMSNILEDPEIPDDAQVGIEYKVPSTAKRIDFILSGQNSAGENSLVIVELKQWTEARASEKDGVVVTQLGGGLRETPHPSYQAWSYSMLLKHFNSAVDEHKISLHPCAYLHNCRDGSLIQGDFYRSHLNHAPLFLRDDTRALRDFIKKNVRHGDRKNLLYAIDQGKIRPSKKLGESLASMLQGNSEFVMVDEQKVVFETAIDLAQKSSASAKNVLIVEGGPGSGKSVVAINLLVELNRRELTTQYITKNAAPRAVYEVLLTGSFKKSYISNLFVGSGRFHGVEENSFDSLIVDEAHRLNEKSGLFSNLGENQVKEIIKSSLFSVFFIDENQRVTFKDIGSKGEIARWAHALGASLTILQLESQYRCNGSDAYLAWVDHRLQIRKTAHEALDRRQYDFRVYDDPEQMFDFISKQNATGGRARVVAGYCWEWKSKNSAKVCDIEIGSFRKKWNLASDGGAWLVQPDSIHQVGCIHTVQGLEMDYVGVIIGPDLVVRNGKVVTDGSKRAKGDQSIKGFRSLLRSDPVRARAEADIVIKNTYRTLLTRGARGCAIFCTDAETTGYFKEALNLDEDDRCG